MLHVGNRPLGIGVLVGTIAANALAHLVAAYDFLPEDWLAAVVEIGLGYLLLFKARGLWRFHRISYWSVVSLTALGAATDTLEIVRLHASPATYFALAWAIVTLVYLAQPRIRALFLGAR